VVDQARVCVAGREQENKRTFEIVLAMEYGMVCAVRQDMESKRSLERLQTTEKERV